MVKGALTNHVHNIVALIAAHQIIQHELQVILIHCPLAGLIHAVAIVQQTPAQQCRRIRIGQGKFQVVSGIIPAARHIVIGHAVCAPADFVPIRLYAALLHLIEKHGFLECFTIIISGVGLFCRDSSRRNHSRCSGKRQNRS